MTVAVSYRVDGEAQSPAVLGQPVTAVGLDLSTEYNFRAGTADGSEFLRTVETGADGNVTITRGETLENSQ